jgi:hypothetical protein
VFLDAQDTNPNNFGWTNASWAIWPAGQIGIGMDPKLLAIAKNSFEQPARRPSNANTQGTVPLVNDPNAPHPPANAAATSAPMMRMGPLTPAAMARVGYDPAKLLDALRANCTRSCFANGYMFFGGGGVEGTEPIPATINEMMLQSFSGVLHVFPDWPRDQRASFGSLRAYGAFLVSGSISKGEIGPVTIVSEKGRDCTLVNPWQTKKVTLTRNGHKAETLGGPELTFHTAPGEHIAIQPE